MRLSATIIHLTDGKTVAQRINNFLKETKQYTMEQELELGWSDNGAHATNHDSTLLLQVFLQHASISLSISIPPAQLTQGHIFFQIVITLLQVITWQMKSKLGSEEIQKRCPFLSLETSEENRCTHVNLRTATSQ